MLLHVLIKVVLEVQHVMAVSASRMKKACVSDVRRSFSDIRKLTEASAEDPSNTLRQTPTFSLLENRG